MSEQKSCTERIEACWAAVKKDLEVFMRRGTDGNSETGPFCDYGLCFDYVAARTFKDQRQGYFRYQFSWGGPSDELRFFADPDGHIHTVQYWFLDWYDGAHIDVTREKCVQWLIDELRETESFDYAIRNSRG